jgi:outer membrane protein assembly factor BamE (lipoprotein component of BamABCDE complex)
MAGAIYAGKMAVNDGLINSDRELPGILGGKATMRERHDPKRIRRAPLFVAAAVCAFVLAACQPTLDTRGYVPDRDALEQVRPGQQKAEVQNLLGTPSSVTPFGDEVWLYISRKVRTVAFFKPEVLEQNVVAVEFDRNGVVNDVRHYTLADGQIIEPVDRKTPAPGRELTFLEQLVGNIGKFNTPGRGPGPGQ